MYDAVIRHFALAEQSEQLSRFELSCRFSIGLMLGYLATIKIISSEESGVFGLVSLSNKDLTNHRKDKS